MWAGYKGAIVIVEELDLGSKGAIITTRPEGTRERRGWKRKVVWSESF